MPGKLCDLFVEILLVSWKNHSGAVVWFRLLVMALMPSMVKENLNWTRTKMVKFVLDVSWLVNDDANDASCDVEEHNVDDEDDKEELYMDLTCSC